MLVLLSPLLVPLFRGLVLVFTRQAAGAAVVAILLLVTRPTDILVDVVLVAHCQNVDASTFLVESDISLSTRNVNCFTVGVVTDFGVVVTGLQIIGGTTCNL